MNQQTLSVTGMTCKDCAAHIERALERLAGVRAVQSISRSGARQHADYRTGSRILGQPPDTASMSFEGSRSMVWMMESLTAAPLCSSVHVPLAAGHPLQRSDNPG